IFVHELGHFAVAKACGVKCEKFYLGFDIGGWKLCKFQWGETEYGIGVLPLGGYVKMLGQDDNPSRQREEMERAKLKSAPAETAGAAPAAIAAPNSAEQQAAEAVFDPRSYLAKSVPQRMAIISAGVIMNVIFAFVASSIAFGMGVEQIACVVGGVVPGSPAWKSGIEAGDRITQMGSEKNPIFRDIQMGVPLADDIEKGVNFVVQREGHHEPMTVNVVPEKKGIIHQIGMRSAHTRQLADPVISLPYAPLALHKPDLQPGDVIVAVDGQPVADGAELDQALLRHPGKTALTVERTEKPTEATGDVKAETRILEIELPPLATMTPGIVMQMGPIAAVRKGSPADAADLRTEDILEKIDGEPPGDPLTLAARLAARAGETVTLTLRRAGKSLERTVELSQDTTDNTFPAGDSPVAVPVLGIAVSVENTIASVEGEAAAALKPGDEIVIAALVPPSEETQAEKFGLKKGEFQQRHEVKFAGKRNWPVFFDLMQAVLPGTKLELTLNDERTATVDLRPDAARPNPDRALVLEPVTVLQKADSLGEALRLGERETAYSLSIVFRFLRKIFSGQVPITGMGGPVTIAQQAGMEASAGLPKLLLFLAMLSANLAVLNFLPIPLLDGGHMVFLAAEGVRGKPVNEQVVAWFQFAGLFFLAGLMLFVFLLDVGLIPRG
ncbi:MAG TPA: site-2 protease family protein, partial [Pirellulales bacterium]|nr:site-2 protease family protein [Pirellulales bacterium]